MHHTCISCNTHFSYVDGEISLHAKDAIIFSPNQVVTKIQVTLIRGGTVLFFDQLVVILGC
jgi:hypothetical protein